jgi:hypothetical protein
MLDTAGAGGLNREAFLRSLEEKALRYSFRWAPEAYTWSMLATSQNIDPAFHHLASAIMRPALSDASMELQRQILQQEIGARSPRERAEAIFLRSLGDPLSLALPEGSFLPSIQFQDLDRFRRRILRPERAVLAIRGDLNLDQARQLVALHFGAWGPGAEPPLSPAVASPVKSEARTWLIDDSDATLEIWVGSPLQEGDGRQRVVRELAAWLLQRELASAAAFGLGPVSLRVVPGTPWVIQASPSLGTRTEDALKDFQALLAHLRARIWTDSDLAWARRIRKAEVDVQSLHPRLIAEALATVKVEEPGSNTSAEIQSPGDIQKIIQGWLDPSALRWLILGGKAEDPALLEKSGPAPGK